jgi:hypothetical protein
VLCERNELDSAERHLADAAERGRYLGGAFQFATDVALSRLQRARGDLAGVLAGHRSSGVLRRLQATGTAPATFVLAHATSTFLLGVVQTAVLLPAASLLFTVQLNQPLLLAITALGYLVFLALGFAISGWVRDPQRGAHRCHASGGPGRERRLDWPGPAAAGGLGRRAAAGGQPGVPLG